MSFPRLERKARRLSWRQARFCELGLGLYESRCRCEGRLQGAKRVPANCTRHDFAVLDPNDPHYIPPMRRRISPRRAVQVIAKAIGRCGGIRTTAGQLLRIACAKVSVIVERERIFSAVRRRRAQILASAERCDGLPLQWGPVEMLDRVIGWLSQRWKGPPGSFFWRVDWDVSQMAAAVAMQCKVEVIRG
jgi:hypothetical protein